MKSITRRQFVQRTGFAAGAVAFAGFPSLNAADSNKKLVGAVMGTNGRGIAHINALLSIPNVEIAYICDVDDRAVEKGMKAMSKQEKKPQIIKDIRKVLEDKSVDFISIA